MKGRAAVFQKAGVPFEIVEFPVPEPEPGAVLIKVHMANICGSDLHCWHGDQRLAGKGPWILGHEASGSVYRLGPGVAADSLGRSLKEGDRVAYQYFKNCGRCYGCIHGQPLACTNTFISGFYSAEPPYYFNGAYGEFFYLRPGMKIFKVPDEVPDELVAPLNCALSEVAYGLHQAQVRFGDRVVIQGAGGLGIYACCMAKEMGAGMVIAVDGTDERLKMAEAFGADHTIDIRKYDSPKSRIARVRELVGEQGADLAVEVVGVPEVITEGIEMIKRGGTYVLIGNINIGKRVEIDPARIIIFNKKILGVAWYEDWLIPRLLEFLKKNRTRYPFDRILSQKFPLTEINKAFEASARREVTRASLIMD